jgi:hypothetical protein
MTQDSGIKAFATLAVAVCVMLSGALAAAWLAAHPISGPFGG